MPCVNICGTSSARSCKINLFFLLPIKILEYEYLENCLEKISHFIKFDWFEWIQVVIWNIF